MKQAWLLAAGLALLGGCASAPPAADYVTLDKAAQAKLTPDAVIVALKQGNRRFVSGNMIRRDLTRQVKATGHGQYPMATVVSCIDSRSGPELVFDQGIGDLFSTRIAGNFVNDDMIGGVEFATRVVGSKLVVVLGHTSCGAIKGACDDVVLGNLTRTLANIKPAVAAVSYSGERGSRNEAFVEMVAEANVKRTVNELLSRSPILAEMNRKGEIKVVGAMLDVSTGIVSWYQ